MPRHFSSAVPPPPPDTTAKPRKARSRMILLAAVVIVVIVIGAVLALLFFRAPAQSAQGVSIENVTMRWAYNTSRGYICEEIRFSLRNNGVPPSHGYWFTGEIEGQKTTWMTTNGLNVGEARTISNTFVGMTLSQAGSYSLTLKITDAITGAVVGQGTFTVQVP